MRVRDARQTFLGVWIRRPRSARSSLDLRRRAAAARLHLRRRRRRGASCSRRRRPRRRRRRSSTSGGDAPRLAAELGELAARRRGQRAATALVPFPDGPEGDRHRRLLRRLLGDRARRSAGQPASASREGLARDARLLPRARRAATGRTRDASRSSTSARQHGARCAASSTRRSRASSTAAGTSSAPRSRRFERERSPAVCGAGHAVGVASGTDAIDARPARARASAPGDEVITASNTCVPTVAAIEAAGATPVLVDVDAGDATRSTRRASRAALTPRTKAIVPVHLYGQPADLEPLLDARARAHGLVVVEDAAPGARAPRSAAGRSGTLGDARPRSASTRRRTSARSATAARSCTADADVDATVALAAPVRLEPERPRQPRGGRQQPPRRAAGRDPAGQAAGSTTTTSGGVRSHARYGEALRRAAPPAPREHPHVPPGRAAQRDALEARGRAPGGWGRARPLPRAVHQQAPSAEELARPGHLARSERLAREVLSLPLLPGAARRRGARRRGRRSRGVPLVDQRRRPLVGEGA